ncbi:hypothetical protein CHS0354_005716 [Potamilus streckersoni]|uniref:folate gamma-glutamyl hydrolase n=1 Tax=Potamilus streckersoni TaxID=2493646 RepID=A0AAE0VL08_9BIVA|nr:hypothetical protein CHS0354_005716 [Potamilus streckersoni]
MALTRLLTCLLSVLLHHHVTTGINLRPVIGVLAQETNSSTFGDTYIIATYIKYIESAGAQVVPIRVNETEDYYRNLFNSINGVLFPGGDVDIITSEYAKAGKLLFLMAVQAHDKGDYFPVWGTCLGFQLLTAITTGQDLLTKFDSTNVNWPLNFTQDAQKSHLLGSLPRDVHHYLTKENVTENFHQYGMSPETFNGNPALSKFYTVLSTNMDRNGKVFISTMEAKKYPIFGVQWHPEKNLFNWNPKYDINHDAHAVRVSQYFASFFVSEARKSNHTFPAMKDEADAVIANYQPVYSNDGSFEQIYYFNYTLGWD